MDVLFDGYNIKTHRLFSRYTMKTVGTFLQYNIDSTTCLRNYILEPYPFFNQYKSNHAFDPVTHLYKGIYRGNRQNRVAAERKGDHHADTPDEDTVEKKRDNRFAAGTQCKVRGVQKGVLRHKDGGKHNKVCCQFSCFVVCVVEQREKLRQ